MNVIKSIASVCAVELHPNQSHFLEND